MSSSLLWLVFLVYHLLAAPVVVSSGPQWDSFDGKGELQSAIDSFHVWFFDHYTHYTTNAMKPTPAKRLRDKPKVEVRLSQDESMRMGVYATSDIPLNSQYLPIPIDMVLSEETVMLPPVSPFHPSRTPSSMRVAEVLRELRSTMLRGAPMRSINALLALALLHETYVAREQSFFAPYLRLLPAAHDTPQFYDQGELDLLRGTGIPRMVADRNLSHQNQFRWMKANVFSKFPDLWPEEVLPGTRPLSGPMSRRGQTSESSMGRGAASYEAWLWANGILDTRMIWWDGAPHLVPMLDMINCGVLQDHYRVHSTFRSGKFAMTLAPQKFDKGAEIFENYGQPNPTYFMYHGFTLERNAFDCAYIDLGQTLKGVSRLAINKLGLKDSACVANNAHMSHALRSQEGVKELIAAARCVVDGANADRATAASIRQPLDMSDRKDRKATIFVGKLLNATLASMVSEEELAIAHELQPSASDPSSSLSPSTFRRRMIVLFVAQRRRHIRETILLLKALLRGKQGKSPRTAHSGVASQANDEL